jgi:hypothetical protein
MIALSTALLLLSLLTVIPGSALPLWYGAVLAAEWGHYFALACLAILLLRALPRRQKTAVILLGLSAGLFLSPSVRALLLARHLSRS